jgi:hypothetical protein
MHKVVTTLVLFVSFTVQSEEIYKCTDSSGTLSFQQEPCSAEQGNSEKIDLKTGKAQTKYVPSYKSSNNHGDQVLNQEEKLFSDSNFYCITTLLNGTEKNHSRFKKSDFKFNSIKKRWEDIHPIRSVIIYTDGRLEELFEIRNEKTGRSYSEQRKGVCDESARQAYINEYKKMENKFIKK